MDEQFCTSMKPAFDWSGISCPCALTTRNLYRVGNNFCSLANDSLLLRSVRSISNLTTSTAYASCRFHGDGACASASITTNYSRRFTSCSRHIMYMPETIIKAAPISIKASGFSWKTRTPTPSRKIILV